MAHKDYQRIGGRGTRRRQFFTRNTLWLGADHLLQVEHTGYTEEYKRFYFRDIQAITVQKDNRFLYWSVALGGLLAGCIALVISVDDEAGKYFSGSFGALFFLLLLVNLFKGPSCYARIKTAVQEEEVPAFRRVWKTQKELVKVRELIASAQGTMSADEIRARLSNGQAFPATSSSTAAVAAPPVVVPSAPAPPQLPAEAPPER